MVALAVEGIDLSRFLDSGIALVECPDCASTRTLELRGGVLRFKSHDKRTPRIRINSGPCVKRPGTWLEDRTSQEARNLMNVKCSDDGPAVIATHSVTERSKRSISLSKERGR